MTEKKSTVRKPKKQKLSSSPLTLDENITITEQRQELDERINQPPSLPAMPAKESTSKSSRKKANSSKNDKELINRMWRYQQAREKWLQNSMLSESEIFVSDDIVNCLDHSFDLEHITIDEWINIQRQDGIQHIIGNDIYLIVEDLGEKNSRIIAPLTATVIPAKDSIMIGNDFEDLVGHEAAESALDSFDIYLNACGPVWAVALAKKPVRTESNSTL